MSLLDQIKLPPLPSVVKADAPDEKAPEESLDGKRFIIVLSREMTEEDKQVFRQHGKVLEWSPKLLNISFEQLEFDYLLMDVRTKEARLTLNRQDLTKYHKVSYVWWIQKGVDDFLLQLGTVEISSIPQHAINRKDFEGMLLNQKISAPSLLKSFLKLLKSCVSG